MNHQQTLLSSRINTFTAEEPVGAYTLFGPQGLPDASKAESSLYLLYNGSSKDHRLYRGGQVMWGNSGS